MHTRPNIELSIPENPLYRKKSHISSEFIPLVNCDGIGSLSSSDRQSSSRLSLLAFSIKCFKKTDEMNSALVAFRETEDVIPEVDVRSSKHHAR